MQAKKYLSTLLFVLIPQLLFGLEPILVKVANVNQSVVEDYVSLGVPIPKSYNLFTTENIRVHNAQGVPVSARFKVLSRYGSKRNDQSMPIRWLKVIFKANVAAYNASNQSGELLPQAEAAYYLLFDVAPLGGNLNLADLGDHFLINTGVAEFEISKNAPLFSSVRLGGQELLANAASSLELTPFTGASALLPLIHNTEIQEGGASAVDAVIAQKGSFQLGSESLDFTLRMHFFSGSAKVDVDLQVENHGEQSSVGNLQTSWLSFEALAIKVAMQAAEQVTTTDAIYGITNADTFQIQQNFNYLYNQVGSGWDFAPNGLLPQFEFNQKLNGSLIASGSRYTGAVSLSGAGAALSVVMKDFWETFPNELAVEGNTVVVKPYPEYGSGPAFAGQNGTPFNSSVYPPLDPQSNELYFYEGGRYQLSRFRFDFKNSTSIDPQSLLEEAEQFRNPLSAYPDPEYVESSGAFGPFWQAKKSWGDFRDRFERLQTLYYRDDTADILPGYGKIGHPEFLRRGGTYMHQQSYGKFNYGDSPWGEGYSGNHYQRVANTLKQFYRSGDYRAFKYGESMAIHRITIDTVHSKNPSAGFNEEGAQAYEKGYYHGNFFNVSTSHTWCEDAYAFYVISGDEFAFDAAEKCAQFILTKHPKNFSGYWGTRIQGWAIWNLVLAYLYLGDPAYLDEARLGIERFVFLEQNPISGDQPAGAGYILNPGMSPARAGVWMHQTVFSAIAVYTLLSGDRSYDALLARGRDWIINETIEFDQNGDPANYVPAYTYDLYSPVAGLATPRRHQVWLHIWGLSNIIKSLEGTSYEDPNTYPLVKSLFRDMVYYYQKLNHDPVNLNDPNSYSYIGYRMTSYPNAESKIFGGVSLAENFLTLMSERDGSGTGSGSSGSNPGVSLPPVFQTPTPVPTTQVPGINPPGTDPRQDCEALFLDLSALNMSLIAEIEEYELFYQENAEELFNPAIKDRNQFAKEHHNRKHDLAACGETLMSNIELMRTKNSAAEKNFAALKAELPRLRKSKRVVRQLGIKRARRWHRELVKGISELNVKLNLPDYKTSPYPEKQPEELALIDGSVMPFQIPPAVDQTLSCNYRLEAGVIRYEALTKAVSNWKTLFNAAPGSYEYIAVEAQQFKDSRDSAKLALAQCEKLDAELLAAYAADETRVSFELKTLRRVARKLSRKMRRLSSKKARRSNRLFRQIAKEAALES